MSKCKAAVLVCVTGQRDCDRLIREGRKIADERSASMHVLSVQPVSAGFDANGKELEYLRQTAKSADAEMTVYFHDDAPVIAAGFAKKIRACHIVTGMQETQVNGFVEILHKLLPKLQITMVTRDGTIYNICPSESDEKTAKRLVPQH
ncbi:MAG TPA: hypothetical protein DIV41_02905 [Ruminococcaceae bacterium]|nr:hypothetical protein [Oscillospiraceae bacterium]